VQRSAARCTTPYTRSHGVPERCAPDPAAGPAWPPSRQGTSAWRVSGARAQPVQMQRGPPGTAALRTQQPCPQLELRAQQRGRLYPLRPSRTPSGWPSASAPKAMRPTRRRTLLKSVRQRPCRQPLRARATPPPQRLQARRRRALLNSVSQHPCGCWLSASVTATTWHRAACVTAWQLRMLSCLVVCTPLGLLTAYPSLTTLLATARMQVGHAPCPWQCS
jgi:hypothetical protein